MRVLSISLDHSIFKENSPTFFRILEYAQMTDGMCLVCYTPKKNFQAINHGKLKIYPTNSLTKANFIRDAFRLSNQIIRKEGFSQKDDVITTQDPFETGLVGYLLKKKHKLGLNVQEHGNFFESPYWKRETIMNFLRVPLGRFILKKADSIRTVSLREKKALETKLKIDSERVINFPVYTETEKISLLPAAKNVKQEFPGFDYYLLTVCRLEKQKNLPLLLKSLKTVLSRLPKTILVIVGSGNEKKRLEKIIKHGKLTKNVALIEWTDDPYSYYKTADLFVMSSDYEGFPRTVIESIACRCPVVMTDQGSSGEFITDGINGWVVPTRSPVLLAKAIIDAMTHPEKRKKICEQSCCNLNNLLSKEKTLELMKTSWEIAGKK